ncbi:MAG: IS66 family transposase [Candidatus Thiodiazotropha taylori]|nr:IS66 family transposase [Candidatus Thiodiazotropha taylori]MCW4225446.1 IS66 family transposase [Candidatus Thiodiazotropha endolucinida]MCG8077532.1 IS66 family transposase [Candidatus Thiodiazotropha taylori]MCG8117070.1 IS66 family transposase [Candidatus Thiodiazotropha taylori]MCW4301364.1 IS66 family transposase [Candidatus Thiodiazotropha endolucinida]
MSVAENNLSDDPKILKQQLAEMVQLLAQKDQALSEKDQALSKKDQLISGKSLLIDILEEYVRLHKLKQFGRKSEVSDTQQDMFNEAEFSVEAEAYLPPEEDDNAPKAPAKSKPRRQALPAELPRIIIEHDLPEAKKVCSCGCQRTEMGEERSEQLDIIPAKIQVLVHVRKKYACKACEEGVVTAPLPPQPIPKSNASPGLLAHIATAKFQDAQPLYRQESTLKRSGISLPRNTTASWMVKGGQLIQPLINLLAERQRDYPILHCDETPLQVLNEPEKAPTSRSYMWVTVGGPPTQPIRLFHYADSRSGAVVGELLSGYQGYLQTDDYAGYGAVVAENNLTHLGCWAHARRYFIKAQKLQPQKKKNTKPSQADIAISLIGKLYQIEREIKEEAPEIKQRIRQEKALPQLDKIRQWLDKALHRTLPKGQLGKALGYLDKNWSKLTVYVEDGRLNIDNNPAENAIRPFVIGRKNWLFSASVKGAKASSNLYSLIETAKANGLEPYVYLKQVFTELPKAKSLEEIEALLPWNVARTES